MCPHCKEEFSDNGFVASWGDKTTCDDPDHYKEYPNTPYLRQAQGNHLYMCSKTFRNPPHRKNCCNWCICAGCYDRRCREINNTIEVQGMDQSLRVPVPEHDAVEKS